MTFLICVLVRKYINIYKNKFICNDALSVFQNIYRLNKTFEHK